MRDDLLPDGKWEFDEAVTERFDDMLRRSIPQYAVMREAVTDVAVRFQKDKTWIIDYGCSRGDALNPFVVKFGAHNRYLGCDNSEPMLAAARHRFAGYIECGLVEIRQCDLREKCPPIPASINLAVLTLQFTPIDHRTRIVQHIHEHTLDGGVFILVEKVLGSDARTQAVVREAYHDFKASQGYTREQIERKRIALEGVLVPVTAAGNEDLLRTCGFRSVECFWRWQNFAAWMAIK